MGDSCAASAYDVGCEGVCLGAADWEACQGRAESTEWSGALGALALVEGASSDCMSRRGKGGLYAIRIQGVGLNRAMGVRLWSWDDCVSVHKSPRTGRRPHMKGRFGF